MDITSLCLYDLDANFFGNNLTGEFFCFARKKLTIGSPRRRPSIDFIQAALCHLTESPVAIAMLKRNNLRLNTLCDLYRPFCFCVRRFNPDGISVLEPKLG